jgi:hypothetical protein
VAAEGEGEGSLFEIGDSQGGLERDEEGKMRVGFVVLIMYNVPEFRSLFFCSN